MSNSGANLPWVARGFYARVDRHHADLGQDRYWCAQKLYCVVTHGRMRVLGSAAGDHDGTDRHRLSRSRTVARVMAWLMNGGWL